MSTGDPRDRHADQHPALDSEVDFDDEQDPEIPEPDAVENQEVGFELDDPESFDEPDDDG